MEQNYSIKEMAKRLNIGYMTLYRLITECQTCKNDYAKCTCEEFNPRIRGNNITGNKVRALWRVSEEAVNKFIKIK